MKLFALAALCAGMACAQTLSVGVLGGVPFTDAVSGVQNGTYTTLYKSSNFVVGPAIQVNLPASLRFEFDALYRPVSFQTSGQGLTSSISTSQWQFPLLLGYRFRTPVVKPFLEAGIAFDHLSGISASAILATVGATPPSVASVPGQVQHTSGVSVVLGGGVEVKIPFVRLSGELRFARQAQQEFQAISNLNQAELMLGVHF
ncbi:MAG TPA: outer membrane beta-barrel protein [Bryobacteraceae bacterium]|nr:outer membrane beta-barrel protein [Bryobacteraceae bacterium]